MFFVTVQQRKGIEIVDFRDFVTVLVPERQGLQKINEFRDAWEGEWSRK